MQKHLNPLNPILIVDDERSALDSFEIALYSAGFSNIVTCEDSRKAMSILGEKKMDLVLLDLIMPHISGNKLIIKIKKAYPDLPVIIITAVNEIDSVVECMRNGAIDYIIKPVEKEQLKNRVRKALELQELERENAKLREQILTGSLRNPDVFSEIITHNSKLLSIFQYCEAVAGSTKPIFVTGETGTGKELIARAIHRLSGRVGEFVAVNIAAFDDSVFADTLFGHVRGAFTSADKSRKGLVEKAGGGTLFFDEIGDLSLTSQVKLLRLLQEQEYSPVGSDIVKNANIRIIASTHRDLSVLKKKGLFREDLYYRLVTHHVHLPPLRERPDDIELLFDYFLELEARELGKKKPAYHPELPILLKAYSYPGNIRELKALTSDAMMKHTSKMLSSKSFRDYIQIELSENIETKKKVNSSLSLESLKFNSNELPKLKETTSKVAEILIREAMKKTSGNQTVAARILGISQQSLSVKLKKIKS